MGAIAEQQVAIVLAGGAPLAYAATAEGGLVVVAGDGRKYRFSAAQVEEARRRLAQRGAESGRGARPPARRRAAAGGRP